MQLAKFPGVIYVSWLAGSLRGSYGQPNYPTLRQRITYNLALHQLPVLLQAPAPADAPLPAAHRLAATYPELTTVVFDVPAAPRHLAPAGTAQSTPVRACALGLAGPKTHRQANRASRAGV